MALTPTVSATQYYTDPQQDPRNASRINVGRVERLISVLGGGGLILYGLASSDLRGLVWMLFGGELLRRGITGHDYVYQLLDVGTVSESPSTVTSLPNNQGITVRRSMTIERSPEDLYRFWRNVENAPGYMHFVSSVQISGERTSHWTARVPGNKVVEWDSEITEDVPNQLIAWKTTNGIPFAGNAGRVRFIPASDDKGTVVTSEVDFYWPGGTLRSEIGKLFGHLPEQELRENLRRFKQLIEAGEVPTISGQPVGQGQPLSQQSRKI